MESAYDVSTGNIVEAEPVRDANENVAYGYLGDIDAQPEVQMVHVGEPE